MIRSILSRFTALALIGVATAGLAQVVQLPPGAPSDPSVAPGPTGLPGGASGTIGTGSTASDGWRSDLEARKAGARPGDGSDRRSRNATRPAKAAELTVGALIADNKGAEVGYIKSVDAEGVTVATAAGQVKVPAHAIGIGKSGLLIGMSKADFDKLVAQAVAG